MRLQHFAKLILAVYVVQVLGGVLATFSLAFMFFGVSNFPYMPLLPIGIACSIGGTAVRAFLYHLLSFKDPRWLAPHSPEALPTSPSGIWVSDDLELMPGSVVLVCSDGEWYRAVVLESLPRNRVFVHYVGWDPFWDEPVKRSHLQVFDAEHSLSEITSHGVPAETAIRLPPRS